MKNLTIIEERKLPEFPVEALPPVLRDYTKAVAASTQTPVDIAAVSVLAAASACMRNCYKVLGWKEPTNIYCAIVGDSWVQSFDVMRLVTKPIDEFTAEYNTTHRANIEMSSSAKKELKKRLTQVGIDADGELSDVIKKIVDFKEEKPLRVYVLSSKKLASVLADNDGVISLISPSGDIFNTIVLGKADTSIFSKAYHGETFQTEDGNCLATCMTVLLTIDPHVIDGFLARKWIKYGSFAAKFLYALPVSSPGEKKPIPYSVYQAYRNLIRSILSEQKGSDKIINFTTEAKDVILEFFDRVEKQIPKEHKVYSEWLGNLIGNTFRIASILARCSVIKADGDITIDEKIMKDAVYIAQYFWAHSVSAYKVMGINLV